MSAGLFTVNINSRSGYNCLPHIPGPVKIIGDPNRTRIRGKKLPEPPIMLAAGNMYDNHELVKTLIDMGADVNVEDSPGGMTPLHMACLFHRIKIVEVLLEHGADVNHVTESGYTPLHAAAISYEKRRDSFGYEIDFLVMKALLQKKPDVNVQTTSGHTPLIEAVRGVHFDNVKALLEAGADPKVKSKAGMTCLHFLLNRTGKTDMMIELIKAGAPLQAVDKRGLTPLQTFLRVVPMSKELLTDIKVLIKTAFLVPNQKKENYYVNRAIKKFADLCEAEVRKMRKIKFSGGITLCDFALRGEGKSEDIVHSVIEIVSKNSYKIYDDYILAHFDRKNLYEKVGEKEIYIKNVPFDIVLPKGLVYLVCNFLSKTDLLNLLRAFADCLPPRINSTQLS